MKFELALESIRRFIELAKPDIGEIKIEVSQPVDISRLPEEAEKIKGYSGIYLIQAKDTEEIIYIGKSTTIINRLYQHIGSNFSWNRENSTCRFPNFKLTEWHAHSNYRETCQSGNIFATAIKIEPPQAMSLLESYVIYLGFSKNDKAPLNIDF